MIKLAKPKIAVIVMFTIFTAMVLGVLTPTSMGVTSDNVQNTEAVKTEDAPLAAEGSVDFGITFPNSSSSWRTNTTNLISWGSNDSVELFLYHNDTYELPIASAVVNGSYNWTIPSSLFPDTNYQIRINRTTNASAYDFSDYFEIYAIDITAPNVSTSWMTGNSYFFYWDSDENIIDVDIELFLDGEYLANIALDEPNVNSYSWAIPTGLNSSSNYQIRINNSANASFYDLSDNFDIYSFEVTMPDDAASWMTSTSHTITWEADTNFPAVDIELYLNGVFEANISMDTANDGEHDWAVPTGLASSANYQIKISNDSDSPIFDLSDTFEIYSVNVLTPISADSWMTSTSHTITWEADTNFPAVDIELYLNGVFEEDISVGTANDGEYEWVVSTGLPTSTGYTIRITNGTFDDYSVMFGVYSFEITMPDDTAVWKTNTSHYIFWEGDMNIPKVDIKLYQNGAYKRDVQLNTNNDGAYYWVIPEFLASDTNYQIRISNVSDSLIRDFGLDFEIYTNHITVTYPTSEFLLESGVASVITWTTLGYIADVDIDLYQDDVLLQPIATNVPNGGTFDWVIPVEFDVSSRYQVKITESADELKSDISENFTISPTSFLVYSPLNNATWDTEVIYTIKWGTVDAIDDVKLELYENGEFVRLIYAETPNDLMYRWGIPPGLVSSQKYQIKITDVTNASNYCLSDFFEIVKVEYAEEKIPGFTPIYFAIASLGITTVLLRKMRVKNL